MRIIRISTKVTLFQYLKSFPGNIESLDYTKITSESTALNCAFITEMIMDFTGEQDLFLTTNGRMTSGAFNFNIKTKTGKQSISINKSQLEIDAGYEGANSLCLIEAKNVISDDFLIRQLYYPYRLWSSNISKPVRSVFLTYTNGIFHFREYEFQKIKEYNSIKLIKERKYKIDDGVFNMEVLDQIISNARPKKEPQIPFPQANSFERVINLLELLYDNNILKSMDITSNYDFDSRQTSYYTDALRYIGFAHKTRLKGVVAYELTKAGKKLFDLTFNERKIALIRAILNHRVFLKVLNNTLANNGEPLTINEVVVLMKKSRLYNIKKESTFKKKSFNDSTMDELDS